MRESAFFETHFFYARTMSLRRTCNDVNKSAIKGHRHIHPLAILAFCYLLTLQML